MTLKAPPLGWISVAGRPSYSTMVSGTGVPTVWSSLATSLEQLGGRHVTAEDAGTSPADMDVIAQRTRWVVGRSRNHAGRGDPSTATARTVFGGLWRELTLQSSVAFATERDLETNVTARDCAVSAGGPETSMCGARVPLTQGGPATGETWNLRSCPGCPTTLSRGHSPDGSSSGALCRRNVARSPCSTPGSAMRRSRRPTGPARDQREQYLLPSGPTRRSFSMSRRTAAPGSRRWRP
jgi:hypothetical protein